MMGKPGSGGAIVLGIDPGLSATGFGVVAMGAREPELIDFGVVRPGSAKDGPVRLGRLFEAVTELVARFEPVAFAIEEIFAGKSFKSAVRIGEARAVAILAAVRADVPVFQYEPRLVKKAVVGAGGASKGQVQKMVQVLFRLDSPPEPEDASDAIAVAVCHCHRARAGELAR